MSYWLKNGTKAYGFEISSTALVTVGSFELGAKGWVRCAADRGPIEWARGVYSELKKKGFEAVERESLGAV